jgi:hypothetical protein
MLDTRCTDDAIAAWNRRATPSAGWRTMESAPDGAILLYNPPVYRDRHGMRQKTHEACIRVGHRHDWPNRPPTRWRPLPAPPAEPEDGK